jgi:hypothetical protein
MRRAAPEHRGNLIRPARSDGTASVKVFDGAPAKHTTPSQQLKENSPTLHTADIRRTASGQTPARSGQNAARERTSARTCRGHGHGQVMDWPQSRTDRGHGHCPDHLADISASSPRPTRGHQFVGSPRGKACPQKMVGSSATTRPDSARDSSDENRNVDAFSVPATYRSSIGSDSNTGASFHRAAFGSRSDFCSSSLVTGSQRGWCHSQKLLIPCCRGQANR